VKEASIVPPVLQYANVVLGRVGSNGNHPPVKDEPTCIDHRLEIIRTIALVAYAQDVSLVTLTVTAIWEFS
jgi:hypothetical protein